MKFGFHTFITQHVAAAIFWILTIPCAIAACIEIATGQKLVALITLIGIVFFRIFFEGISILFSIHAVLVEIRDQKAKDDEKSKIEEKLARAREVTQRREIARPAGAPSEQRMNY